MGTGGVDHEEIEEHALCIHAHREETGVFHWNVCGMRKCAALDRQGDHCCEG